MVVQRKTKRAGLWARKGSAGFTFAELLVAVAVTAVGLCAVLAGIREGVAGAHEVASLEQARGVAESLRQFAETLSFRDPDGGGTFGPEEGDPANYDDLDDLDGLAASPPLDPKGMPLAGLDAWSEAVTVTNVDPTSLVPAADGTTAALWIAVTVKRGGGVMGVYRWIAVDR